MIKTNLHKVLLQRELDDLEPFTDAAVAEAAGLNMETVSRFRRDVTARYDAIVLDKLCRTLDVTPADLLLYDPSMTQEDKIEGKG